MPITWRQRFSNQHALKRLGFGLVSLNLLELMTRYGMGGSLWGPIVTVIFAFIVGYFFAILSTKDTITTIRIVFCFFSTAISIALKVASEGDSFAPYLAAIVFHVFLLVILFRVGLPYFILLNFVAALIVCLYSPGAEFVIAALSLPVLFIFANYLAQLVLDHRHEFKNVKDWLAGKDKSIKRELLSKSVRLFMFPLVAVAIGAYLNYQFQAKIRNSFYEAHYVLDQPEPPGVSSRRDLETDTFGTIDYRETQAREELDKRYAEFMQRGDSTETGLRGFGTALFDLAKPPPITPSKSCANSPKLKIQNPLHGVGSQLRRAENFGRSVLGMRRKGSPRGSSISVASTIPLCTSIVGIGAEWILSWYERTRAAALEKLNSTLSDAHILREAKAPSIKLIAEEQIRDSFEGYRRIARTVFSTLRVFSITSYIFIAAGLVGGFFIVVGRVFFDRSRGSQFRLSAGSGFLDVHEKALTWSTLDRVNLGNLYTGAPSIPSKREWYVCFDAARYGDGTHMDVCFPQKTACLLQRLRHKRLFFTRVRSCPQESSTISAAGDAKLVAINIEANRQIVFHMADLVAFTSEVQLQSVYSTHFATEFFGTGAFYCVAQGPGFLVLKSEGHEVISSKLSTSFPTGMLIAWDRAAAFRLIQNETQRGVWANAPSIESVAHGTAIFDESRPGDPNLLGKIARLLRYVALPF